MNKVKKWDVYLVDLEPTIGSEQGKTRPVIVISEDEINNILNCINILPITSRKPNRVIYPNEVLIEKEVTFLVNESIVLCHQIRTIDKKRLIKFYGNISKTQIPTKIIEALTFQLGL
jgi:mRNA interferase MazF